MKYLVIAYVVIACIGGGDVAACLLLVILCRWLLSGVGNHILLEDTHVVK